MLPTDPNASADSRLSTSNVPLSTDPHTSADSMSDAPIPMVSPDAPGSEAPIPCPLPFTAPGRLEPRVFLSCSSGDPFGFPAEVGLCTSAFRFAADFLHPALEGAKNISGVAGLGSIPSDFPSEGLEVAARSRVVVPVISPSYTRSFWCMLELDAALHSSRLVRSTGNRPHVIPVFVDASESERLDTRQFWQQPGGLPLEQYLRERLGLAAEWVGFVDVERWANNVRMLQHQADADELVLDPDERSEAVLKLLANRVVERVAQCMPQELSLDGNLVGVQGRVREMLDVLNERKEHRGMWLYGPGGIGKSTMARLLFNCLSGYFSHTAVVSFEVGEGSDNLVGPLSDVLCALRVHKQPHQRSDRLVVLVSKLAAFLRDNKVLLLLDNVQQVAHLDLLPRQWGNHSRVIVTSGSPCFSGLSGSWQQVVPFQVQPLEVGPATQLFRRCADLQQAPPGLEFHERQLVAGCSGLPLLLRLLGKCLWGTADKQMWEELDLRDTAALTYLPESFGDLRFLRKLNLSGCTSLAALPESFSNLTSLRSLDLHDCSALKSLPESFGGMTTLTELNLSGCTSLADLPASFYLLNCLQKLLVCGCTMLGMLPSFMLPECVEFDLSRCDSVVSVNAVLIQLRALRLSHCSSLDTVNVASANLRTIRLQGCSTLRLLQLNGCAQLTPVDLGNVRADHVKALQEVHLYGCSSLHYLPNLLRQLTELRVLVVVECRSLASAQLAGCNKLVSADIRMCNRLDYIDLSGCTTLANLGELSSNPKLRTLNLEGCTSLTHIPRDVGILTALASLNLEGCRSLTQLPVYMGKMQSLKTLNLASCHSLVALPRTISSTIETLDLSHCSEMDTLAESLIKLQLYCDPELVLNGWDELLSIEDDSPIPNAQQQQQQQQQQQRPRLSSILQKLRHATVIYKLVNDHAMILELLARLSWLAVLLGAATFTAAIAPPGGYDNGMLFLAYKPNDCPNTDHSNTNDATFTTCSTLSTVTNCTTSTISEQGCLQKADDCTNDVPCSVKPHTIHLHRFFILDLLSFGLAMTLVMFVVMCSIPRSGSRKPIAAAGLIWLSLVVASGLLFFTVVLGIWALLEGLLAVYPKSRYDDVLIPCLGSIALVGITFMMLLARWWSIFPGWWSIWSGLASVLPLSENPNSHPPRPPTNPPTNPPTSA